MSQQFAIVEEGATCAAAVIPLTHDNLFHHTSMYSVEDSKAELLERFQTSIAEYYYHHSIKRRIQPDKSDDGLPIDNVEDKKQRCRHETNNIMIDCLPLPFPYHNDAIFIPAAESGITRFDSPSCSSSAQSTTSSRMVGRSSSPSLWLQTHELHRSSRRLPTPPPSPLEGLRCSSSSNSSNDNNIILSKYRHRHLQLTGPPPKASLSAKLRRWSHKQLSKFGLQNHHHRNSW